MNELVFRNNNQIVTSSRNVARDFDKRHSHVLDAIDDLLGVAENSGNLFHETTYVHEQNKQEYREYLMDRDGFTLLVMGFTGKEAMQFKLNYMAAFNEMESQLNKPMSPTELALLQAQNLHNIEKTVKTHDKKLTRIERKVDEQMTLDYGMQRRLQRAVAARVYKLDEDQQARRKLFSELYREIKDRFGVASYKDVRRQDLQTAINYVENWIPRKVAI